MWKFESTEVRELGHYKAPPERTNGINETENRAISHLDAKFAFRKTWDSLSSSEKINLLKAMNRR